MARKRDLFALGLLIVSLVVLSVIMIGYGESHLACQPTAQSETRRVVSGNIDKAMMETMLTNAKAEWDKERGELMQAKRAAENALTKARNAWEKEKKELSRQLDRGLANPPAADARLKQAAEKANPVADKDQSVPAEKKPEPAKEAKVVVDEKKNAAPKKEAGEPKTPEPAKKVDAAPKLDGGAVSKAPAAAAAIGGPGENHDGAEPEDLQDKGECGDQSHDQAEKGLKPPRLVSEKAFQKGDRPEVRWAVIFPFHGNKGSHRIESVNISWTSLERAMRNAIERETKAGKPKWGFDVLFVDDSDDQSWLPKSSDIANIYYCAREEGCTNKGHIYMHVKRGYRWGFQQGADYIIHFDSDLLLLADFFHRMHGEYETQSCSTAIISGYTSSIQTIAYGSNYMFNRHTYRAIVKAAISPCHAGWDGQDWWGNKPWDNFLLDAHNAKCPPIWRPGASWAYHLYSPESLHPAPIELSRGFQMDDFNHNLLASATLYTIKDVRELDGGHQLDVRSTTNHTCKVRTGLAYSDENIVQAIRADDTEECCKKCWETDGCESFSFFEHKPFDLCHMKGPALTKDWKYETQVSSGFRVTGKADKGQNT